MDPKAAAAAVEAAAAKAKAKAKLKAAATAAVAAAAAAAASAAAAAEADAAFEELAEADAALEAAIAGSESPGDGGGDSILESPKPGGESSTFRKRERSGETKLTTVSKNPLAVSIPNHKLAKYEPKILVLFETPSGFAIFSLKEYYLNKPKAMEKIWAFFGEDFRSQEIVELKKFRPFKDKSSGINHSTGVNKKLSKMIFRYHSRGQTLAVGKSEYKTIIEAHMPDVPCRFDEIVMEVMWGLQYLMHSFFPKEVNLTKEDHLPMCKGIKIFLDRYYFDVKPEMVNDRVIESACILFDIELIVKRHYKYLRLAADKLKDLSGIDSTGWNTIKLATALKLLVKPISITEAEQEMFTEDELTTFLFDKYKYEGLICRGTILRIHSQLIQVREAKKDLLEILDSCLASCRKRVKSSEADPIYSLD